MTLQLPISTERLGAGPESIGRAAAVLRQGRLVAFPTETVYGLGADAENPFALRALFTAKGRPSDHPVIVHLADGKNLSGWAAEVPPLANVLAAAFWPGPMTLVLRRGPRASDLVTGGLPSVGLRVPAHPVAQALLREFGSAIAAPSANRFGRVSCTRAEHVLAELDGRIDMVLDGGACDVGLESTIIDLTGPQPSILRPGAVTAEQLQAVIGAPVAGARPNAPRVSGSLASHYAPRARVELVDAADLVTRAGELAAIGENVAVLTHQPISVPRGVSLVALPADRMQLAQSLYAALRRVDELGCEVAVVALPESGGIGEAIADRLRRAAGPRDST